MKKILSTVLTLLIWTNSAVALDISDTEAINRIIQHFSYVWNNQNGHGIADNYAQDATFVSHIGMFVTGRDEIEIKHQLLQNLLIGSIFEVSDMHLREIQPGVVIAHVFWNVSNIQGQGKAYFSENMKGIFTHVFLKKDEKWEIITSQNTIAMTK